MSKSITRTLSKRINDARKVSRSLNLARRDRNFTSRLRLIESLFAGELDFVSIGSHAFPILVSITTRVDGFNSGKLPDALAALMDAGVEFNRTADFPQLKNRDFYGEAPGLSVSVQAFLTENSTTCRQVVVGERTITQPIYQLVCD